MEDDLQWKMTFNGRWPLTEDGFRWKTIFIGKQHSMQDDNGRENTELLNWRIPKLELSLVNFIVNRPAPDYRLSCRSHSVKIKQFSTFSGGSL